MSTTQKQNNTGQPTYLYRLFKHRAFWYLSLISIVIRFPFFFRDYVDRDESTFILMGQAWVDGFLPYTVLWDVKPPLTFFFYAAVIFIFGKSFIAIRLMGALLVSLSAYFTYAITLKLSTKRAAIFSGIGCVFLQSMFGSIQGVMSEHILMLFFMAALYFLISGKKMFELIVAGALLGIALMVKINIAFPVLLLGIYLLFHFYRSIGFGRTMLKMICLTVPALAVIFITFLPYYLAGSAHLWWDSVVLAPLAYTEAGRGGILPLLGVCLPILLFIIWAWRSKRLDLKRYEIAMVVVSIVGLLLSFLKGGRINGHYLIQLYPPLLIIIAIVLGGSLSKIKKKATPWIVMVLLLLPIETYIEYGRIVRTKWQTGTFYNGEGFTVPAFLKANGLDKEQTLFLGYHIGYWVLDQYPPAKSATHPSNICKSEMFPYYNAERKTAVQELHYLMEEIKPSVVITRTNRLVFDKTLIPENTYIDSVLSTQYVFLKRVDNANIYKLSD